MRRHGEFLSRLVEPVNGFIILDLHNFYCQLHNFGLTFDGLIGAHPLDRVREIHISGGSWEPSAVQPGRNIRRDTHDNAVPREVFELLAQALPLCPNVKFVVLEQIGRALRTSESRQQYREDFETMRTIVDRFNAIASIAEQNTFLPLWFDVPETPVGDETLYRQQLELSAILETATGYSDAKKRLEASSLAGSEWKVEDWSDHMLEAAVRIAGKWKEG